MTRPWYVAAFESSYADVYQHRSDARAVQEVAWAAGDLDLHPGALVLDLACGNGRHAAALAASGHGVVGIDLSRDLLAAAHARGDGVRYVRADMRRIPLRSGSIDATLSLFTSFGYFDDEADDRRVLHEIARVTRPGGGVLLDFLNAPQVVRDLVAVSERQAGSKTITEKRWITPDRRRVEKSVVISSPDGGSIRYVESVRLYGALELERAFAAAGLEVVARYGSLAGDPFDDDAPRLVLRARTRAGTSPAGNGIR